MLSQGDAQGMIGYSRGDEMLQLLLEYVRHRENGHDPLIICGKKRFMGIRRTLKEEAAIGSLAEACSGTC